MDEIAIFNYARRFADKAERSGRGTEFPTIRQAARRFRCPQQAVMEVVECADASCIPGAEYFGLAVGVQISGGGCRGYDSEGDYQIEAYRKDSAHED
jgi:hypothetical protein